MADAISAMRDAFAALANAQVAMPTRAHINVTSPPGTALFMPSYASAFGAIGIKTVTLFDQNPSKNLPLVQGLVSLFDGETGTPIALLDASMLTALRTGAVSGLATDLLARRNAATVAVFGAGIQGRSQLDAVCQVRRMERAHVFDPNLPAAEKFAHDMSARLNIRVVVARSPQEAVSGADVVCTATVSSQPVFRDRDLARGTHINAIGSYKPTVQEIPTATVQRAYLVVDHRESALAETGDLIIPLAEHAITEEHIRAELGALVIGRTAGRESTDQLTVFKSVGLAVQDLAAACKAVENARRSGQGTIVAI
jgi:ornithine cyclodeaminase/alanine dehydrogenase-like protein (mu-crystallin family)